jgi:hypothetical protein
VVSDVTTEGACYGTYSRTISWKAVDACGNESNVVSQTINVVDNTAPIVNPYSMEITVRCDQFANLPLLTATDACSNVIVRYTDATFSGGCPGTVERDYTFTDACNNVSYATQFITINDPVAPVFTSAPAGRTFACGQAYVQPIAPTATDNCDDDVTVNHTSSVQPGACPQQQRVVHTWTAIDDCQNQTIYSITDIITLCPDVINVVECDQYVWFGNTYSASGHYEHTEMINGCPIVYAINLTINHSNSSAFSASSCVSYRWNNMTYNSSGNYVQVFENAAGCDSTVTLHLTIKQPTSSQFSATACGSYTWNGNVYTSSGAYTYHTTNAAGCDSTVTLNLTINTPSVAATFINVSTATPVVSGTPVTLTVNGGSLGTGASWKWYSGSCGGTLIGTGNSIVVTPSATTTYFVRAEGTCNTTACVSRTVTVTPPCGPVSVSSNAPNNTTCSGSSVTLTVQGTLSSGAAWKWYKNACGGVCVGTGSSLVVTPTCNTTYYVRAEGGSCGTTSCMSIAITVNTTPLRPAYITGITTGLCRRTGVSYCVPAVAGATSYQWTVPAGATIVSGQGTTCITVNFSGSLGNNSTCGGASICVRAVNSCGVGQPCCVSLSTAPSGYSTISGLSTVGHGITTTYSVGAIVGATNYAWSIPSGWQLVSGQGTTSITVITGNISGNVSVTPSNACAIGTMIKKFVNITGCRNELVATELEIPAVVLYPNPANNQFFIDSGDAVPSLVEVMDMTGKVVYTGSQVRRIESNSWTSGIYFVRVHFNDEVQVKRIEIMH